MFHYYGYGSNMNITSLAAKGVQPVSAEPAVLSGWQLTFNIPDFFLIEGGTGNIVPSEGSEVHGVLFACADGDLSVLDSLEAVGVNYERREVSVTTYSGAKHKAHVYVGMSERLKEGFQPSRRYLNILIRGAEKVGLAASYIRFLRVQEVKNEPVYRPFRYPESVATFGSLDLTGYRTAIAGAVFDTEHARADHAYLRSFLSGKDMTLFFLCRMDSSDGMETLDDVRSGRLNTAQKRYLNYYLQEFDREYQFLGRMDYDIDLSRDRRLPVGTSTPLRKLPTARSVIEAAETTNHFLGHENLGFLSYSHGFMPKHSPKLEMPQAFREWDEVASDLPRLYRTLELRQRIDHMRILDASEEFLSDSYLLRAASLLAMLAHAYHYVETTPPACLPSCLAKPWREVRRRLGRDQEVLTYIDLIVTNYRLLDPLASVPVRLENMDLLIPTVGNREERVFYLIQTEILARSAPILGAIARSQEAVLTGDKRALEAELLIIFRSLESIVYEALPKLNPNEASSTYVDAVVWAKTVAPFAVPLTPGLQGPSGTSSPIFNLLDVFFGRTRHESFLGKEIKGLRATYPHFWREFLEAVGSVSIPDFVSDSDDPALAAIFREAFGMYAGPNGFLGRHRTKVYGFLETAFKVGRSVTIGGFSGLFKERTWEQVDLELEYARLERSEKFPSRCYYGTIKSVGQTHLSSTESVKHIVIDIAGSGILYQPGDRCGILPENSDLLVDQTLSTLGATGDEVIQLTEEWLKAVQLRYGFENTTSLNLRTFLRFAKLRPVVPRVAEALHALSQNQTLAEAIKSQTTARWQLSDLLLLLRIEGTDPKSLWQSAYTDRSYIARILPPEQFRMYSISSGAEIDEVPNEIHLTVGRLRYSEENSHHREHERLGTASNFLTSSHGREHPVSLIIEHPPRFSLPHDPSVPIIMIGGGTGFAPFRSFIANRLQHAESGQNWLLLSLGARDHFYYQDDLIPSLAAGTLTLDVVFSREDVKPMFHKTSRSHGFFDYEESPRAHIQDLLNDPERAAKIWQLLLKKEEGGQGAYLYICGRTHFAKTIYDTLKSTFAQFFKGDPQEQLAQSQKTLAKIAADGRLMQEIFTQARSWKTERQAFNISDIVDRNRDEKGYWVIIDSVVYDMSDFLDLHPGGRSILLHYCGLDATQAFAKVHHGHSEIEAMRDMYEIGIVRPLDFKGEARTVDLPGAMSSIVALSALYRKWVGILFLVVEMENALRLDHSLQTSSTTRGELTTERTHYKIQRAIETHQRFIISYLNELGGKPFIDLWDLTRAMSTGKSHWMKDVMNAIHDVPNAKYPLALGIKMNQILSESIHGRLEEHAHDILVHACTKIETMDIHLLLMVKSCLKRGVAIFEEYQDESLAKGAWHLIAELQRIPVAFEAYYQETRDVFAMIGGRLDETPCALVPPAIEDGKVLLADHYWTFDERHAQKIVILRRTPVPVSSLADLVGSNERIIALLDEHHAHYGIVVDMREAPQRNDTEFENAMAHLRYELASYFKRITVLLETTPGLLQVDRIARSDGIGSEIFATTNEYAAVKFAKSASAGGSPQPPSAPAAGVTHSV
ncbi:MAG: gamma-glutamylcyclotransferase [Chitinophagaceae bacterium]|nr:gamma-glutamylcyclotransferase [Oligoflexus sp.]